MNPTLEKRLKELKEKYPHPNGSNLQKFRAKQAWESTYFTYGIVVDNKDPECLGRVRVQMDGIHTGCVGPWFRIARRFTGNKSGFWSLPDIGTQVLVCFPSRIFARGYVIGCLYDLKHYPPKTGAENPAKSQIWQTKKHRIEIIDEEGKEGIYIYSAKGKMRAEFTKNGGIKINNELGDIKIKCRKLIIDTGENVELNADKKVSLISDGTANIKSSKNMNLICDKEVKFNGKNVKLSGSKGVTTEGKQIATQDSKVMGFDTHIMVIPAGTSTANVPLPHPFIGKIGPDCSSNVKIKDKGVATKGSKAKHDDSMHLQLPGTIKFQNNPKKEGEVTGGTVKKLKVNGKEVAVLGSFVTTCNYVGMQNNSTIIAPGVSIPMPVIINPLNTEEYKEEQELKEKHPAFQNVKWSVASVDEGIEAEMTCGVKDIADGNMITLQVYNQGNGPETSSALASFPCMVKGGSVSAKWSYKKRYIDEEDLPPEQDPKFIFTAHSAWCNYEKSSNALEVKLVRPEITKVEWHDKDGNSVSKGLVGEVLKLYAETKDVKGGVTFNIYDDKGKQVYSTGAKVEGNKAEAEWTIKDSRVSEDRNTLKYKIEVKAARCKSVSSNKINIKNPQVLSLGWDKKAIYYGNKAILKIRTFELSDESPTCKLQLWEKDYTTEDDLILEQDITIDSDELEQEIDFNFDVEKVIDEDNTELEVFCRLIYNEIDLAAKIQNILIVRTSGGQR